MSGMQFYTFLVLRGEVWPRDRGLEVICMEVTMKPTVLLRLSVEHVEKEGKRVCESCSVVSDSL